MAKKIAEEIKIERVRYPNRGEGIYDGLPLHFKGGVPGRVVDVQLTRNRGTRREGRILTTRTLSPWETETPCPAFGRCGGCSYQRLPYEKERQLKTEQIRDLFRERGFDIELEYNESPLLSGYRNKMEFTFGDEGIGTPLMLGLHAAGKFYEVVDTTGCNIAAEDFDRLRRAVVEFARKEKLPYYRKRGGEGFLRHLVLRSGLRTDERMVNLVTTSQQELDRSGFVEALLNVKLDGRVVTVIHTINDAVSDAVIPEEVRLLYGPGTIREEMNGLEFEIRPFSFFQPNPLCAEKLYDKALEYLGEDSGLVYDLYSGTGTITQLLAARAKKAVGIEIVGEAVEAARANALRNGIDNVEFIEGDVLDHIRGLPRPDAVVLDPPREGIHPKAVHPIIDLMPEKFVYISCNPASLVRDLEIFEQRGYKLKRGAIFDQFPRTVHCEVVALLSN